MANDDANSAAIGWTALAGGTLFEFGAIVLLWDALNPEREAEFGKELAHEKHKLVSKVLHRPRRARQLLAAEQGAHKGSGAADDAEAGRTVSANDHQQQQQQQQGGQEQQQQGKERWVWWGFNWRDLGYVACFLQLIGATVFWVSCITAPPGVLGPPEDKGNYKLYDGAYWAPQVAGATFFILSAIVFMLEVQHKWWQPRFFSLGWHVGFWNLVGAIGFWLSGFFGFWKEPDNRYQHWGTSLSTFWGGWAFLSGSYAQLLESLNKHPGQ